MHAIDRGPTARPCLCALGWALMLYAGCQSGSGVAPRDGGREGAANDGSRVDGGDGSTPLDAGDRDADAGDVARPRCAVGAPPSEARGVALERAFTHTGLRGEDWHRLIELVPSPFRAGEWYLIRQHGQIFRFHEDPAEPGHSVALDLSGDPRLLLGPEEAGLGALAFHPVRREAYVVYTAPTSAPDAMLESRLSRFDVRDDGSLDAASEQSLLVLPQPRPAHSGDHVLFSPDGMLYYSVGDGGLPRDDARQGQDAHSLYGTILRLDVDRADESRGTAYAIPPDNPYADGVDGAPEVYAYGMRNPWRFSFDRDTGALWMGDVGESRWEEINRVEPGGNYGWSVREGPDCFRADGCADDFIAPVLAYPHDDGISVIGGHVYRGGNLPALRGRYLFADYIFGHVWSIPAGAGPGDAPEKRLELTAPFWISSFAQSPAGELYLVNFTFGDNGREQEGEGGVFRLVPATTQDDGSDFPTRLSETGCVDMQAPDRPAPGLIAYAPRARLWSDGASKDRFLRLPEGGQIEVRDDGDFVLPEGSILVKSFRFGDRPHETRLLVKHAGVGWRGYSYRWNAEGSEATLLEGGRNELLEGDRYWRYPSRTQCDFCHTEAAGHSLGLEAAQLDFAWSNGADGGADNQLEALDEQALFAPDVELQMLRDAAELVDPRGDAPVAQRARSYLHANCAICHRPGGPTRVALDLRIQTPLADMGVCDVAPSLGSLGGDPAVRRLLAPGNPDDSVLLLRMQSTGGARMPPLGTVVVDTEATELVRAWIEALAGC